MAFEDIVERILLSRKTLTRDKVLEMIKEKKVRLDRAEELIKQLSEK